MKYRRRYLLAEIRVRNRVRKDVGDLSALKESITSVGLLQPLVVDADGLLVAGWRRLRAVQELGWTEAPTVIAENLKDARLRLLAERDENVCRVPMTGHELSALARQLLDLEKAAARERQKAGGKTAGRGRPKAPETVSEPIEPEGKALDQVASAVGVSAPSIRKGLSVLEAYRREPDKYQAAKPALDARRWTEAARIVAEIDGDRPAHRGKGRSEPSGMKAAMKALAPPANGLQFARMAIRDLEQIRRDDVERTEGFDLVEEWINDHKEE